MNAYYTHAAAEIFPIYGATSLEEAQSFVDPAQHRYIVETADSVYMNAATGSVDFSSSWEAEGASLDDLVLVNYSAESESWVEA